MIFNKNSITVVLFWLMLTLQYGCQIPQDDNSFFFTKGEKKTLEANWTFLKNLQMSCIYDSGKDIEDYKIFFGDIYFQRAELCGEFQNKPVSLQGYFNDEMLKKTNSDIYANLYRILNQCFWIQIPRHETVGITVRSVLEKNSLGMETNKCALSLPENQSYFIDMAPHLKSVSSFENVRVLFWREDASLFFYSAAVLSQKGTTNVFLTPGKEYSLLILYPLEADKYAYHCQIYHPGEPIKINQSKTFSSSLQNKRINKIFPFRGCPMFFASDEEAINLQATMYLQISPFATQPQESIFCAFYEGDSEADIFGEPGTVTFSSEGFTPHIRSDFKMKPFESSIQLQE